MNRYFPAIVCLLLGVLYASAQSAVERKGLDGLQSVPRSQLSRSYISVLGEKALTIRSEQWQHSETSNFIYHYFDSFIATPVSVEAEAYYRMIAKDLGKDTSAWERKSHIFIFQTREDWALFIKNAALDPWTGGLHANGELFVLRLPKMKFKGHTLAHEIAHLVVQRFFPNNIPLWLNEGYAEYAGIAAYTAYYRARNYRAKPTSRAIDPKRILPLGELTERVSYPENAEEVAIFYDESHRLVRFLAGVDRKKFNLFFDAIAQGRRMENALYFAYGSRFATLSALEKEFTSYATRDYTDEHD